MAYRRLKIVSDGTGPGTRVTDAETGEDLSIPLIGCEWHCNANGLATVALHVGAVSAELLGEGDVPWHFTEKKV